MKRLILVVGFLLIPTLLFAAPAAVPFAMYGTGTTAAPPMSRYVTHTVLTINTAATITVPTGYSFVNPVSNSVIYINCVGTAVVPAGAVTDGTGSAMSLGARYVGASSGQAALTSFSIISASAAIVTFEWWK